MPPNWHKFGGNNSAVKICWHVPILSTRSWMVSSQSSWANCWILVTSGVVELMGLPRYLFSSMDGCLTNHESSMPFKHHVQLMISFSNTCAIIVIVLVALSPKFVHNRCILYSLFHSRIQCKIATHQIQDSNHQIKLYESQCIHSLHVKLLCTDSPRYVSTTRLPLHCTTTIAV